MFYVGQKVVCVDVGPMRSDAGNLVEPDVLIVGEIYTITYIKTVGNVTGVQVAEAVVPKPWQWGFLARRFRPVVERKTDISELVRIAQEAARTGKVFA